MASIMILSMAIIPMVGMFDVGLRTATLGGNYDKARALAQKQAEKAQSGSYSGVRSSYPHDPSAGVSCPGGTDPFDPSTGLSETTGCADSGFPGFTFDVRKQFLAPPGEGSSGSLDAASDENRGYMRIEVVVRWDDGPYSVTGLKTR